jgi:hypothetical protein
MVLLKPFLSPLLLVIATSSRSALASLGITDLFEVSFDSNVAGNCADYSETILNGLLADAITLAKAGQSAAEDAISGASKTSNQAERLLSAFFLEPSDDEKQTIRSEHSPFHSPFSIVIASRHQRREEKFADTREQKGTRQWCNGSGKVEMFTTTRSAPSRTSSVVTHGLFGRI